MDNGGDPKNVDAGLSMVLGAAVCKAIKVSLAMTLPSLTKLPFPINALSFKWTARLRIVPWDTLGMPHITESAWIV